MVGKAKCNWMDGPLHHGNSCCENACARAITAKENSMECLNLSNGSSLVGAMLDDQGTGSPDRGFHHTVFCRFNRSIYITYYCIYRYHLGQPFRQSSTSQDDLLQHLWNQPFINTCIGSNLSSFCISPQLDSPHYPEKIFNFILMPFLPFQYKQDTVFS